MTSFKGEKFVIHPITICACKISLPEKWTPDVVLFNNDCSQNPGDIWDYVHVPVVPSTAFGWHRRKKSWFFESWNRHAERFASCLSLDSWYFKVRTERVGPVDFKTDVGMKCLVESVDRVIQSVADDYRAHKIDRQPAVFIKHASGTYGMGVMTVKNSAELLQLNRKTRNKMSVGKGKRFIDEVIVQEAIPSAMRSEIPDEPVIYAVGYGVVGGFMRTNQTRTVDENLNSQGMQFAPLSRLPPHIVDVYKSIGFQCTVALAQEMVAYGPHDEKDIE
jgi:glutamate--cysteine ligase